MPAKAPYRYPKRPHTRRHGPQGYLDLESFRPWLRDEFQFRCVYCLEREAWKNPIAAFDIDHFEPSANSLQHEPDYDNLHYVCHGCNLLKGAQKLPNPLNVLIASSVIVQVDGTIQGKTPEANRLIRLVGLNRPEYVDWRRLVFSIVALAVRLDPQLLQRMLAYPEELPDLSQLRPPKNRRPAGIRKSCYARRAAGRLPEAY